MPTFTFLADPPAPLPVIFADIRWSWDGRFPLRQSEWARGLGYVEGRPYTSLEAYLAAAGATFTRASDATFWDADGGMKKAWTQLSAPGKKNSCR